MEEQKPQVSLISSKSGKKSAVFTILTVLGSWATILSWGLNKGITLSGRLTLLDWVIVSVFLFATVASLIRSYRSRLSLKHWILGYIFSFIGIPLVLFLIANILAYVIDGRTPWTQYL